VNVGTRVPPLGSPALRVGDARVAGSLVIMLGLVAGIIQVANSTGGGPVGELIGLLVPIVVGGVLIAVAGRLTRWMLSVITAATVLPVSGTAIQHATRGGGAGGTAGSAALVLIALQMCAFRSRREAWLQFGWAAAVFGTALALEFGVAASAGSWAIEVTVLAILTAAGTWTRRSFDEMLSELHHQADHDPLTGLFNRDGLHRHTTRELDRLQYSAGQVDVTVLMIDIDHFKTVNDTWGHPAGDEVLVWLSGALRASVTPPESVARFGGEEFLVVLPGKDLAVAYDRAERLRQLIASAAASLRHPVTVSIGVACGTIPTRGGDLSELYPRADEALYRAKEAGRNRVEVAAEITAGVPVGLATEGSPVGVAPTPTPDRRSRPR
jgi:diguanylate cyclase (GGDEF)-like protein